MKSASWPVQEADNPTNIIGWLPATMHFGPVREGETQAGVITGVEGYTPIGGLLTQLMEHLAWEHPNMRERAKYFTRSNIGGGGSGTLRFWPYEIFSETLRAKLSGDVDWTTPWSEWNHVFP